MDELRDAIQKILDAYGDGWTVANFVVAVGLERITSDDSIETSPWWVAPKGQPEYVTDGLLAAVEAQRAAVESDGP